MMESPVIVENCANFATPVQSGFPFDDTDYETHDHFEARLNDLAQRHPELADHLRFPSLRRKRYGSGSSQDQEESHASKPGASTSRAQFDSDSRRFGDHSFPSGFNRFPFSRHFEDFVNEPRRDDKPPEVPKSQEHRSRKPNPYLPQHLSNTVDLGQKQSPVEEKRSQRSMSAPPENRSAQNVSSARVQVDPPNAQQQEADMGKSFSKQGQPDAQPARGRERIIPIHVEGRDDPVIPKNTHTVTPEKVFGGERVHHPGFQQYSQPRQQQQQQQSHFPKHSFYTPFSKATTPPSQQAPARDPSPAPPNAPQQQQQQASPQPQQAPSQAHQASPPPPPIINDPLEKIKIIRNDVMELMTQVEKFVGTKKDRYYLYLDEMLTRNLLKLDNIETEGKENIRQARKEAIKCIQTCINKLEAKAQEMEQQKLSSESSKQTNEMETDNTEAVKAESEAAKGEQETKVEKEEAANKAVFKSEATLVISGASKAGEDGDKAAPAPMETEVAPTEATPVQKSVSMETEAATTQQPADASTAPVAPTESTSPDNKTEQTASSQSTESAASQK